MMAPKYERVSMLNVAITAASHELVEPIDRIEVFGSRVVASARGRRVVLACECGASYDAEGRPYPSGGSWSARVVSGGGGEGGRKSLLSRLFRGS